MYELKRLNQDRRDFYADYKCEKCGHIEHKVSGYDDAYFNITIVSKMKCPKCNKSASDLGIVVKDTTIVPEKLVI